MEAEKYVGNWEGREISFFTGKFFISENFFFAEKFIFHREFLFFYGEIYFFTRVLNAFFTCKQIWLIPTFDFIFIYNIERYIWRFGFVPHVVRKYI